MVSICMSTYRHEQFIQEAIEGVMMQETRFSIELVIGEDRSDDNTRAICQEMEKKYPAKIRLLPSDKNYGQNENLARTLLACDGIYIALCEGDDYWMDPKKLQKQVDFMQAHNHYVLCFHRINTVDENGHLIEETEPATTVTHFKPAQLYHVFVPTLSLMFRNCLHHFPSEFFLVKSTDAFIVAMLATHGNGADLGFTGGCYRKHSGGLYNRLSQLNKYKQAIQCRKWMKRSDYFDRKNKREIKRELMYRMKLYVKIFIKKGQPVNCLRILYFYFTI